MKMQGDSQEAKVLIKDAVRPMQRGQITLPKKVRELLDIDHETWLWVKVNKQMQIVIEPIEKSGANKANVASKGGIAKEVDTVIERKDAIIANTANRASNADSTKVVDTASGREEHVIDKNNKQNDPYIIPAKRSFLEAYKQLFRSPHELWSIEDGKLRNKMRERDLTQAKIDSEW